MNQYRPVRGLGLAASVLIGLVAFLQSVFTVMAWRFVPLLQGIQAGTRDATQSDVDELMWWAVAAPLLLVVQFAAFVVYLVWLWRARTNAQLVVAPSEHRLGRGWAIGAWFVPIANLILPWFVVSDVWRACDHAQQHLPLRRRRHSSLVTAWWVAFALMEISESVTRYLSRTDPLASLDTLVLRTTVHAALTVVAAVLAVKVIRQISGMQSRPYAPPPPPAQPVPDYQGYS